MLVFSDTQWLLFARSLFSSSSVSSWSLTLSERKRERGEREREREGEGETENSGARGKGTKKLRIGSQGLMGRARRGEVPSRMV
jgi:hypothetical protein